MFFGAVVWDPWLIIAQIVCLQCLYYLTLGLVLALLVGTRVSKITLFYFFDFAAVSANSVTGWFVIASFIISSLAGAKEESMKGLIEAFGKFAKTSGMSINLTKSQVITSGVREDVGHRILDMTDLTKGTLPFEYLGAPIAAGRAGYLVYLIERAKKCLDFSATVYIIHLIICISYGGWPSSFTWWIVNIAGLAVMALLGEYLCVRRELREIPIARYRPIV